MILIVGGKYSIKTVMLPNNNNNNNNDDNKYIYLYSYKFSHISKLFFNVNNSIYICLKLPI